MIYFVLVTLFINIHTSFAESSPNKKEIASIVMARGSDITIYSGSKKTTINNSILPTNLYPGDEVRLGQDSDCELVFANNDTMYVGAETLFSVDLYRNGLDYIWIKYGTLMYRGGNPIILKASDMSIDSKGGDFLVRYKRSTAEATILNFGSDIFVKQGDDERSRPLKVNHYVKLTSFRNKRSVSGTIVPKRVPAIYNAFSITYTPNDKDSDSLFKDSDDKSAGPPSSLKGVNLDYVKRTIGL